MYFEYHHSKTTKTISPLQVQLIYHVQADCTYQTNHIAGSNGCMVFVYTYQGQGFLKCPEGEFILTSGTALVFSSDAPYFIKHSAPSGTSGGSNSKAPPLVPKARYITFLWKTG